LQKRPLILYITSTHARPSIYTHIRHLNECMYIVRENECISMIKQNVVGCACKCTYIRWSSVRVGPSHHFARTSHHFPSCIYAWSTVCVGGCMSGCVSGCACVMCVCVCARARVCDRVWMSASIEQGTYARTSHHIQPLCAHIPPLCTHIRPLCIESVNECFYITRDICTHIPPLCTHIRPHPTTFHCKYMDGRVCVHAHPTTSLLIYRCMGWLRLVGSFKL